MTARLLTCTDAEYFADPCRVPSLSQSIATTLLNKSPKHAWLEHPRLGNRRRAPSKAMDEGTLIHRLLLGEGAPVKIVEVENFRTKVAQEARDEAIAAGALPVKRADYDAAFTAVLKIRANMSRFGIDLDGASERAIEWEEDGGVLCRARLDHVLPGAVVLDVKKAESAHPRRIQRAAADYGMDIQHAAYTRAMAALYPEFAGRVQMMFVFCEMEAPYEVVPAQLNGAFRAYGEARWLRAVAIWKRCLERNEWPGYCSEPISIELPPWLMSEIP